MMDNGSMIKNSDMEERWSSKPYTYIEDSFKMMNFMEREYFGRMDSVSKEYSMTTN